MTNVGSGEVSIFPSFSGFRSKVTREVDGVGKESGGRFSSAFKTAVTGAAAVFGGIKIKEFFKEGIAGASELEQSVGAVGAIFKDSAGQIGQWSASAQNDVGLTKNEFNTLGSLIGAQLKNGGTAMDQLAPKTNDLIKLGADLSSMFGGDTKSAVEALSSALKGERDPIERYGVSLNQAKIDAEAAALGFEKVDGALSSEANQAATLSLIMKQTADAHGNFAKESDTLAGKQQRLSAMWVNGKTAIVGAFLPAVSAITGWLLTKLPGAIDRTIGITNTLIDTFRYIGGYISGQGADVDIGWLEGPAEKIGATVLYLQGVGRTIGDTFAYIRGYMSGEGSNVDIGWLERPAEVIADVIMRIREAVAPMGPAVQEAFASGDFSALSSSFESIFAIVKPFGPALVAVGTAVGGLSETIGRMVGSALPLLAPLLEGAANVMQFLADNTGVLTAAVIAIAAGFVIYKVAQIASNFASAASVPVTAALAASNLALASAMRSQSAATAASTATITTNTAAKSGGLIATLRQTAATVASRVAQAAAATATGIATAAQWAWNAALTANPIGLIILAIAALVAGLVWFFTQTDLGRGIWTEFMSFLSDAWNFLVLLFQTNIAMVTQGWSAFWNLVSTVASTIWNAIVLTVTTYINLVQAVITAVLMAITGTWNAIWTGITTVISTVMTAIGAIIGGGFEIIRTIISTVLAVIQAIFTGNWDAISGIIAGAVAKISGIVSGMVEAIKTAVSGVGTAIGNVKNDVLAAVSNAGNWLKDSGRAVIQGFIDGIKGMAGKVGDAAAGVMDWAKSFFPHSPAKRGPFSGAGWRAIKSSGLAIGEQLGAGLEASEPSLTAKLSSLSRVAALTPARATAAAQVEAAKANKYPDSLTIVDADGDLIGRMRVEAKGEIKDNDDSDSRVTGGRRRK